MGRVDPKDGTALHKVAADLQKRFCLELGDNTRETKNTSAKKPVKTDTKSKPLAIVNAPLDFELKGLDAKHPYLLGRGFTSETIAHFGLGLCSRGYLKDRVAIPLLDVSGIPDGRRKLPSLWRMPVLMQGGAFTPPRQPV